MKTQYNLNLKKVMAMDMGGFNKLEFKERWFVRFVEPMLFCVPLGTI